MAQPIISYKIVELDSSMGRMKVKFTTPEAPLGVYMSIDLPSENGNIVALPAPQLAAYIMGFAPHEEFAKLKAKAEGSAADLSYIAALVEPESEPPPTTPPTSGTISVEVVV